MTDARRTPRGFVALMTGLIDYAGLFPPAALDLADAVHRYRRYRQSADAWALARFVVPAARLEALEREVAAFDPGPPGFPAWSLTALASLPPSGDYPRIVDFNERHAAAGADRPARVESIEMKAASPAEIERACASAPPGIELYFEVPIEDAIDDLCRAAAAAGQALKIRTGGTTLDAFPPSALVARALAACAASRVPFKATAGLHHPVRAPHPVTYDAEAPRTTMHGFLNVFVAASLLYSGKADASLATRVLEDELPASFSFGNDGLTWRDRALTVEEITAARRFARSFGSCSFEEPMSELANL